MIKPSFLCLLLAFLSSFNLNAQWSTDKLSQARDELTACKVGNKLIFAGGSKLNPLGNSKVVDMLDLGTMTWSVDSLSAGRDEMNSAVLGDDAYFVGSSGNSLLSRKLDIYHSDTDTWESLDCPSEMYAKSITANGGKVFISGYENVNIYDPETGEWEFHTLPLERNGAAAVSVGSKVMFAGGYNDGANNRLHEVDVYDIITGEWTVEYLSEGRSSIEAVVHDGKAYFAGGTRDDYSVSKMVDIYDSATGEWSVDSLSVARSSIAVAELGGLIYFAGGLGDNGEGTFNIIDIYNSATGEWTMDELSIARSDLAAVSSDNAIYFAGGWPGSGYTDLIDIFSITTSADDVNTNISAIKITPNPVADHMTIRLDMAENDRLSIHLLDMQGRRVREIFVNKEIATGKFEHLVSCHGLMSGMYLLEVKSEDERMVHKVMVE